MMKGGHDHGQTDQLHDIVYELCIGNHTHSSPIWEIVVLAIKKIVQGKLSIIFENCLYTIISQIGRNACDCLLIK